MGLPCTFRSRHRVAAVVVASIALAGCAMSLERQHGLVGAFFSWVQVGSGRDYYLVKTGLAGRERVAVIFGFLDDAKFCREVAEAQMARYPNDRYSCEPAN